MVREFGEKIRTARFIKNGSTLVVQYTNAGAATPMKVTYPQPGLTLDYTASGALDRFGRITDHAWKNAGGTALVQIKHGYDRVGNRLYREDVVAANNSKNFDELYSYDGVNQLVDMQRGKLNVAKDGIPPEKIPSWSYPKSEKNNKHRDLRQFTDAPFYNAIEKDVS
ncbi:MAG: hypothetical protein FWH27_16505 [Planctomycetaceae bacterium]|nr:hypothetical protein [Planctomycetaceae bacterium]